MAKQWSQPFDNQLTDGTTYTGTLETSHGTIEVEFYPEDAPITVNNCGSLAREGFFDGTPFHRIVKGFVIQGGDPTGTGTGGPGYRFKDEAIRKDYEKGTLAMANAGPNTNGSQFFIVLSENGAKSLQPLYSLFGQVTSGMDTVGKIGALGVPGSQTGAPKEKVTIESVTINES